MNVICLKIQFGWFPCLEFDVTEFLPFSCTSHEGFMNNRKCFLLGWEHCGWCDYFCHVWPEFQRRGSHSSCVGCSSVSYRAPGTNLPLLCFNIFNVSNRIVRIVRSSGRVHVPLREPLVLPWRCGEIVGWPVFSCALAKTHTWKCLSGMQATCFSCQKKGRKKSADFILWDGAMWESRLAEGRSRSRSYVTRLPLHTRPKACLFVAHVYCPLVRCVLGLRAGR